MKSFIPSIKGKHKRALENPIFPPMSLFNFQQESEWMENKRKEAEAKERRGNGFIIIAGFGCLSDDIKARETLEARVLENIYKRMP